MCRDAILYVSARGSQNMLIVHLVRIPSGGETRRIASLQKNSTLRRVLFFYAVTDY